MANNPASPPAAATTKQQSENVNVLTKNTSPAEILLLYGLLMMLCGALAFYASSYARNAKSALYMGNGSALVCFMLATGTRNHGKLKKGDAGYGIMMMSIHLALIFPLIMAAVVSWRLSLAWNIPSKAYVLPYLATIIISSLLAFVSLYSFKPKKNKNNMVSESSVMATETDGQSMSATQQEQQSDSGITMNGRDMDASDVMQKTTETGSSDMANTVQQGSSKSSDKPHKQHVVRRRPRRAQAM